MFILTTVGLLCVDFDECFEVACGIIYHRVRGSSLKFQLANSYCCFVSRQTTMKTPKRCVVLVSMLFIIVTSSSTFQWRHRVIQIPFGQMMFTFGCRNHSIGINLNKSRCRCKINLWNAMIAFLRLLPKLQSVTRKDHSYSNTIYKKRYSGKRQWTLLVIVKDQSSHLLYPKICTK